MKSFKTYLRMLAYIRPYALAFVLTVLFSLAIVGLDGISIWFLGSLPQAIFHPSAVPANKPAISFQSLQTINEFLKYETQRIVTAMGGKNALSIVCLLIILAYTTKNILVYVNRVLAAWINIHVIEDIRNKFYRHILMLPVTYFDRSKSGAIVSLIVNDISNINNALMNTLSTLTSEPVRLIFFIGLLCVINFKLTLIVFLGYPALLFIIVKIGTVVRRRSRRALENYSGVISVVTETVAAVRAVKMFNMYDAEYGKFRDENRKFSRSALRSERPRAMLSPITEMLSVYAIALLLWYGGSLAITGHAGFAAEDFFRFLFILFASYQPVKTLAGLNAVLQGGIAAAERVFELFDVPGEPINTQKPVEDEPEFKSGIELADVCFTYPGTDRQVISNVSFSARKGQVVAIVGSSGAGKSTILDLLPRFYEIDSGTIRIDNKDIRDIGLVSLRGLFGIVAQDTVLFNDTVRNNIAYGKPGASAQEIREAALAANALEFIDKLPGGMDAVIGERGASLSGGQQQRLSIARALLRNPPILILDEATSSLDSESERLVQNAIAKLMSNRTVFVVAHRLTTIQRSNMIIVLEQGKIVEQGTHADLLAAGGRYRYLHDMQFSNP